MNSRRIAESPIEFGEDEYIAFQLTIPTTWGLLPSSPVVEVKDSSGADVTSTTVSGSSSASGQVITLAYLTGNRYRIRNSLAGLGIQNGQQYRLEVRFTVSGGNILEAWALIDGQE